MSDVKKFNVLGQIADIKDVIARENAIKALNKMSNFVNVVTDCGADNTAQTDYTEAIKKALNYELPATISIPHDDKSTDFEQSCKKNRIQCG